MAYTLSERASGASDLTAKNRIWDFFGEPVKSCPANRPQSQQLRRKISPAPTETASGIPYWPSRDPIGEGGGINLNGYVNNDGVNKVDVLGLSALTVSLSCKGHEKLLENMTYFAEEEPHEEGSPEPPKVHRSLPNPGQSVQVDAVYYGNGKADKIPTTTNITIVCECVDGKWKAWEVITDTPIPFTDQDETRGWLQGTESPPAWPADPTNPNNQPYTGEPPVAPQPPLNPADPAPAPPDDGLPW